MLPRRRADACDPQPSEVALPPAPVNVTITQRFHHRLLSDAVRCPTLPFEPFSEPHDLSAAF